MKASGIQADGWYLAAARDNHRQFELDYTKINPNALRATTNSKEV